MNPQDRFKDYHGDKCWQAYISEVNRDEDLLAAGLTEEEASMLRIDDFVFEYVDKENKQLCKEVKEFIMRHEWLAKLPNRPTHRFTARKGRQQEHKRSSERLTPTQQADTPQTLLGRFKRSTKNTSMPLALPEKKEASTMTIQPQSQSA